MQFITVVILDHSVQSIVCLSYFELHIPIRYTEILCSRPLQCHGYRNLPHTTRTQKGTRRRIDGLANLRTCAVGRAN